VDAIKSSFFESNTIKADILLALLLPNLPRLQEDVWYTLLDLAALSRSLTSRATPSGHAVTSFNFARHFILLRSLSPHANTSSNAPSFNSGPALPSFEASMKGMDSTLSIVKVLPTLPNKRCLPNSIFYIWYMLIRITQDWPSCWFSPLGFLAATRQTDVVPFFNLFPRSIFFC